MNFLPRFHRYLSSLSDPRTPFCYYFQWAPEQTSAKRIWPISAAAHSIDHAIRWQQVFHFFHLFCIWLGRRVLYMLYVFRRGSSSGIIGDDGRLLNMAMRALENRFYYNFFIHRHTHHHYFSSTIHVYRKPFLDSRSLFNVIFLIIIVVVWERPWTRFHCVTAPT